MITAAQQSSCNLRLKLPPLQADAIRDSLKSLFSETELPDNPYYYLAAALGAYVDQNPLWAEPDVNIILKLDQDGGMDVVDAASKLCKLAAAGCVLGLPHVLRAVSKEGVTLRNVVRPSGRAYAILHSMTCTVPLCVRRGKRRVRCADKQPARLSVSWIHTLQCQGWIHSAAAVERAGRLHP